MTLQRHIFEEEHVQFRDSVARFVKNEIAPHVEAWRRQGCCEREVFEKAGQNGFLLMWADEQYGGAGITDFRFEQIVYEETIRHGDIGVFLTLHSRLVAPYIGRLGTKEQKQRFLPPAISGASILAIAMTEPGAGSDLAGLAARAEQCEGGWRLSGTKTYISNGLNADVVIVVARTNPDDPRAFGLFLVERGMPGFERGKKTRKTGPGCAGHSRTLSG